MMTTEACCAETVVSENVSIGTERTFFPKTLVRLGALPTEYISALRDPSLFAEMDELSRHFRYFQHLQLTLDAQLFEAIGASDDSVLQRTLLNIKRKVFNGKRVDQAQISHFSKPLQETLKAYEEAQNGIAQAKIVFQTKYETTLRETRKHFQQTLQHESFQKGLIISSHALSDAMKRYEAKVTSGKQEKEERGLLKYATRAAMKATPFGTFCTVVSGEIEENAQTWHVKGDVQATFSQLRLNKNIFAVLVPHLLSRPKVRLALPVELNPTLQELEKQWLFLTALNGVETFQRVGKNAVLALVIARCSDTHHVTLRQLVELCCTDTRIEASFEEAEAYLNKLLEIGLLRFRLGLPEQEPNWDSVLRKILAPINDEHAQVVAAVLGDLREDLSQYKSATIQQRTSLLQGMKDRFEQTLTDLEILRRPMMDLPFYEDAGANASISLPKTTFDSLGETWQKVVSHLLRVSPSRIEQATMRHFFEQTYQYPHAQIPLLEFYETFYREHFKAHLEKQTQRHKRPIATTENEAENALESEKAPEYDVSNPFNVPFINEVNNAHTAIVAHLQTLWHENLDAEEIGISLESLAEIVQNVPVEQNLPVSISSFAEFLPENEGKNARLSIRHANGMMGLGKYFSRFLYLVDERFEQAIFEANQNMTHDIIAEICGDASFNANLHPPLLTHEISYPTCEGGAAQHALSCTQLVVEADPENAHRLQIRDTVSRKRVHPVDLGFLNPQMRPPLFQLLSRFSPSCYTHLPVPTTLLVQKTNAENSVQPLENHPLKIVYRPRFVIENQIVISRRQWRVPAEHFPMRAIHETAADYAYRLREWQQVHHIPNEVYVRIQPLPMPPKEVETETSTETSTETNGAAKTALQEEAKTIETEKIEGNAPQKTSKVKYTRYSKDFSKPQYIAFDSPLLIGLFSKLPATLTHFEAVIEEALPARLQQLCCQDQHYATELVLQINEQ